MSDRRDACGLEELDRLQVRGHDRGSELMNASKPEQVMENATGDNVALATFLTMVKKLDQN
jgi:hypothetical protein